MPYISASIMLQLLTAVIPKLGRLAKEDGGRQKIMQITRYATLALCLVQGYLLAVSLQNPASNPMLGGITETINRLGIPLVADPGMDVPHHHGDLAHRGHAVPDVAWRSDHRARHRQRHLADHHRRHRGAVARGARAGVENVRADWCRRERPGESGDPCADDRVPLPRHRGGHRGHARRPQDYGAIRQARGRPEDVRRADAIHAAEGELRGRDADHLCVGAAPVSRPRS